MKIKAQTKDLLSSSGQKFCGSRLKNRTLQVHFFKNLKLIIARFSAPETATLTQIQ